MSCGKSSPKAAKSAMRLAKRQIRYVMADCPPILGQMLRIADPEKSQNVMQAMLQMTKIDIATLNERTTR